MAQEAQDQTAGDAQLLLAILQCRGNAVEHDFERDASVGVGLRVEERFGVNHVLLFAAQQVGPGQVIEVLGRAQHIGTPVIQIEELLQVVEGIRLAQGFDVVPWQGNLVALGQGEQQLRLQRAFQVQVQFCLGQGVQPFVHNSFLIRCNGRHSTEGCRNNW
ncbi:hypothetical protein D3C79_873210 [compost metagenome]